MATIVVVDDDPIIVSVFKDALESLGHVVISAKSCAEANTLINETEQCIDMMVTDYHLPDGKGLSNIQCLMKRNRCAKVILMSSDIRAKEYAETGVFFLHKPFSLAMLADTVQSMLSPVCV